MTPCYHCGGREAAPYDSENGYHLVKCLGCGILHISPMPAADEITAATRTGLHRGEETLDMASGFDDGAPTRYRRILDDFFSAHPEGDGWLDIGCGHGEFLVALGQRFPEIRTRGCEPHAGKAQGARERGLDVSFFDLEEHAENYDFLSALNVFSHLPDPVASLRGWARLLRPGGQLLLETGHSCHLPARHHHKPYFLPDHLSFAKRDIVEEILGRIGLQVVKTKIYRHTVFPPLALRPVLGELRSLVRGREHRLGAFFPRSPKRDLFVLAEKPRT